MLTASPGGSSVGADRVGAGAGARPAAVQVRAQHDDLQLAAHPGRRRALLERSALYISPAPVDEMLPPRLGLRPGRTRSLMLKFLLLFQRAPRVRRAAVRSETSLIINVTTHARVSFRLALYIH